MSLINFYRGFHQVRVSHVKALFFFVLALSLSLPIYLSIYLYVDTYIYIYICIHIYRYIYIHIHICRYIYVYICVYIIVYLDGCFYKLGVRIVDALMIRTGLHQVPSFLEAPFLINKTNMVYLIYIYVHIHMFVTFSISYTLI